MQGKGKRASSPNLFFARLVQEQQLLCEEGQLTLTLTSNQASLWKSKCDWRSLMWQNEGDFFPISNLVFLLPFDIRYHQGDDLSTNIVVDHIYCNPQVKATGRFLLGLCAASRWRVSCCPSFTPSRICQGSTNPMCRRLPTLTKAVLGSFPPPTTWWKGGHFWRPCYNLQDCFQEIGVDSCRLQANTGRLATLHIHSTSQRTTEGTLCKIGGALQMNVHHAKLTEY